MIRAGTFEEIDSNPVWALASGRFGFFPIPWIHWMPLSGYANKVNDSWPSLAITSWKVLPYIKSYLKERITLRSVQCQFFFFSFYKTLSFPRSKKPTSSQVTINKSLASKPLPDVKCFCIKIEARLMSTESRVSLNKFNS